jgi:predicted O-methyltransferase YrrM
MPAELAVDLCAPHTATWRNILKPYKGKPSRFLEIGSFEGGSASWMLENFLTHPHSTLTCVDPFHWMPEAYAYMRKFGNAPLHVDSCYQRFWKNVQAAGGAGKVTLHKGISEEALRMLPMASFDVIYIDGSHMARNVLTDIVLCWGLLNMQGIMIIDDYKLRMFEDNERKNPGMGIDAFLKVYAGEYEILHADWQIIVRKVHHPDVLWKDEGTAKPSHGQV